MKTLTIDRVHGRDLKPQWAEKAQVGPDEEISIRIMPSKEDDLSRLDEIMSKISEKFKASGGMDKDLKQLLEIDDEEVRNLFGEDAK